MNHIVPPEAAPPDATSLAGDPLPPPAPVVPAPFRPWGAIATSIWCVALGLAFVAAQVAGAFLEAARLGFGPGAILDYLDLHGESPGLLVAGTFATLALEVAVIALAVRLARARSGDYLALRLPRRRDVLVGIVALAGLLLGSEALAWLFGLSLESDWFAGITEDALAAGQILPLAAALGIAAPVSEELVFRGFLFRGWAASRLGPAGAVLLTSALWAAVHTQYDPPILAAIFGFGLLLGWLRHRSGSVLLPMLLHGLHNLAALAWAALCVGGGPG